MEPSRRIQKRAHGDLVIAVDRNYFPMMELSRRHAVKALVTERAEVLCLDTWNRKAWYEIEDFHGFSCILYPTVQAVKDTKLKMGKGFRGVLERDEHTCQYCNKRATTVDHVVPKSQGGGSSPTNLVAACLECNQKKANRTPEQANMPLLRPIRAARWRLLEKFNTLTTTFHEKREEQYAEYKIQVP